MDREVPALVAVIEPREEGEVVLMRRERLEQPREVVITARFLRPESGLVKPERVADGDQAHGPPGFQGRARLAAHGQAGAERAVGQGFQQRQRKRDAGGLQEEATVGGVGLMRHDRTFR